MAKTITVPKETLQAMGVTPTKQAAAPKSKAKPKEAAPAPAVKKGSTGAKKSTVAFVVRKAKKGSPLFAIEEQARPTNGRKLFAHTHAALTVLGMLEPSRPAVAKRSVLNLMGQRAMSWHVGEQNFEVDGDAVRLSADGHNKFKGRAMDGKIDNSLANGYVSVFLDGKVAEGLGVTPASVYQTSL